MSRSPDRILVNGRVRTLELSLPTAQALAIRKGRITAVGTDDEIRRSAGPETGVIDLEGRLAIPGMIDAHFHYYDWAMGRRQLDLSDARSREEVLDRVAAAASRIDVGTWIIGQGWNEAPWPDRRMPGRDDLDGAAPAHPVALWRCDLHLVAVNSRALELAGIDRSTTDPPEGVIGRDATGRPDGILREHAVNRIKEVILPPGDEELTDIMAEGIPVLHSLGLTGIQDVKLMDDPNAGRCLRCWQDLRNRGDFDLRCWASLPGEAIDEAIGLGLKSGFGDDRLRIGHLKYFADGGMGARTAWMIEPYLDADVGMPLLDMEKLRQDIFSADRAGLAVMVHAIGDRANREIIDIFEALARKRGAGGGRPNPRLGHRIEHLQMVRPEDVARLARLGVTACMQPTNMVLDIEMIDTCVGDRGRWTYPFREVIDAGIPTLFSSDAPVCDPNPLAGIHAAVTRQRPDGRPASGWHPRHRVGVEAALRAYTADTAAYYGLEGELGTLAPGKRADIAILDRDIFTTDPSEIRKARVEMTLFDGRVVFRR